MFHFSGFNMMFPDAGRAFTTSYKAFSVSMLPGNDRQDVEKGGKIIMPPSALDALTRLNVEYPMLFKLVNHKKSRTSHAGVLEFVADEGKCYLPNWMMDNLLLEEGDLLNVESVSLPVATFSKFQPHNTDFLDITNPKAVLENALRNFACLTTGDVIAIKYNRKVYELCVLETKPGRAVSIIECDMNVEFEAPVGYKEPAGKKVDEVPEEPKKDIYEEILRPFDGNGLRLDGKEKKLDQMETPVVRKKLPRGIPDYDFEIGTLTFDRSIKPITSSDTKENDEKEDGELDEEKESNKWGAQGLSMRKNAN